MEHLDPEVIPYLDAPNEVRIKFARTSKFIKYQQSKDILFKFHDLLTFPGDTRMRNYLLIGESNHGKTAILEEFLNAYKVRNEPNVGPKLEVFYFQAPNKADESRLYSAMLDGLNIAHNHSDSVPNKLIQVKGIMKALEIKALVIDELHNVAPGTPLMQRAFLTTLKFLSNDLKVSMICAGTNEAHDVISYDKQLTSRFTTIRLESWNDKPEEFIAFLKAYERKLPLKKPSNLANRELAKLIFKLGEGLLGEYCTILKDAAVAAIRSGEERITIQTIKDLNFDPPSKRSTP